VVPIVCGVTTQTNVTAAPTALVTTDLVKTYGSGDTRVKE
jgi:hypothetical protein